MEQEQAILVSPRVALQPHPYVVHHQLELLVFVENAQKWQVRQEMVTGPPKVHVSTLLHVVQVKEVVNVRKITRLTLFFFIEITIFIYYCSNHYFNFFS